MSDNSLQDQIESAVGCEDLLVPALFQHLVGTSGEVVRATVEEAVFKKINHTLVAGGRFVFSVEHPVIIAQPKY